MGKPEQGGSGAIIAVLVVGMLLLIVVLGGAAVLLGGLFFVAYESPQMTVSQPSIAYQTPLTASQQIELDAAGNITIDGASHTPEELRQHLLELQQEAGYVTPRILADVDCPDEARTDVISICEEVTGSTPELFETIPIEPAALPPIAPSESN